MVEPALGDDEIDIGSRAIDRSREDPPGGRQVGCNQNRADNDHRHRAGEEARVADTTDQRSGKHAAEQAAKGKCRNGQPRCPCLSALGQHEGDVSGHDAAADGGDRHR
ncbi:hypothetical protein D3C73_1206750 [compost metagenome]